MLAARQPALDTPGNTDAAHPAAPAGEWPKWTVSAYLVPGRVRVHGPLVCWWADAVDPRWHASGMEYKDSDNKDITRAEAVALIGEDAVAEGEWLAGGAK
jgi:hypothetical protein